MRSEESWESRDGREGGLSASCVVLNGTCVCDCGAVKDDLFQVLVVVDLALRSVNCLVCGVMKAVLVTIGDNSRRHVVILLDMGIFGLFWCCDSFSFQ